ncbi:MAG: magnesium-dependent phosphatase-1 [bacterium]
MPIKLVILDCDRTLWDHHNASDLKLPLGPLDGEAVQDASGVAVRLLPGARQLLETLREHRILISIASWNTPEPVYAIFDLLGLSDFFIRPKVDTNPHKDQTIAATLRELAAEGIVLKPEEVLFVDDKPTHLAAVRAGVGPVRTLQAGVQVRDLREILDHVVDA